MTDAKDVFTNVLEHHGVKGMRWGVRKDDPGGSGSPSGREHRKAQKKAAVETRKQHKELPDAEEAVRAKEARTKIKNAGVKKLSNKELQDLVTRMNLEQQYQRLASSGQKNGQDIVKEILTKEGQKHLSTVIAKQAAKVMA